jgi:hypothetical protein
MTNPKSAWENEKSTDSALIRDLKKAVRVLKENNKESNK